MICSTNKLKGGISAHPAASYFHKNVSKLELHFIVSLQTQTHPPTWFREGRDRQLLSHPHPWMPCTCQPLALGPTELLPLGWRVKTPVGDTETPVPPAPGTTWPEPSGRHQILPRHLSSALNLAAHTHLHRV